MPTCPNCSSEQTVKNGHIHNGKQRFKCHECGRQFVENPQKIVIDRDQRELIDRLLLEKISLAGIARAAKVSERWLQTYVNQKYALVPREISVMSKKKGKLTIQCDELWSFVDNKGNKQWVWLALDADTREIVGVHIGDQLCWYAERNRKTLSFSKSLENHIGAIWYFIHHYNESLLV